MDASLSPSPAPRRSSMRTLTTLAVVALIVLVIVIDLRRRAVEHQLAALSVRLEQLTSGNGSPEAREEAKKIVDRVRKHYVLPTDIEPTVATIVDVETLRKQNPFYNKAENGFHLIVTPERALLYDPVKDVVVDVVPVQIQPETDAQAATTGTATPKTGTAPPKQESQQTPPTPETGLPR